MESTDKRVWMVVFFFIGSWRAQPATARVATSGLEEKINRLQHQMSDMQKEPEAMREQKKKRWKKRKNNSNRQQRSQLLQWKQSRAPCMSDTKMSKSWAMPFSIPTTFAPYLAPSSW